MRGSAALAAALRVDGLRMVRDRFLVGTALYVLGISLAMRWIVPWVTRGVQNRWAFDLMPYHPLIMSHVVVQLGPLLVGVVGGFLLLETREGGTLRALLATPLPLSRYLAGSSAVMACAATGVALVQAALVGIALPPWPALVGSAAVGSLTAPVFAVGVAAVASTKTEAFAYLKLLGILPVLASGAYFLREPLQWIAAVYPPYLAVKAYWIAEAGGTSWPLWLGGGVAVSGVWIAGAVHLFRAAARR